MTENQTGSLLTIEQVAAILKLHVRTVRNYVRSGMLRATRIGKQYRIAPADLEKLTGSAPAIAAESVPAGSQRVEVSSVLNIDGITGALAGRITALLAAMADALRSAGQPVLVSSSYEAPLRRLRVLLAADLKTTREVLAMIGSAVEPG